MGFLMLYLGPVVHGCHSFLNLYGFDPDYSLGRGCSYLKNIGISSGYGETSLYFFVQNYGFLNISFVMTAEHFWS